MKKFLSIFLVLLVILGISSCCIATEIASDEIEATEEDVLELTDEEIILDDSEEEYSEEGEEYSEEELDTEEKTLPTLVAKVIELGETAEVNTQENEEFFQYYYYYGIETMTLQSMTIEIIEDGEYKGMKYEMQEPIVVNGEAIADYKVGKLMYVQLYEQEDNFIAYKVADKKNTTIIYIVILTAILLIAVSLIPGLKTIGLIVLNIILVIYGAFNLYTGVLNMYWITAIVGILLIASNVLILNKINKKSFVIIASVLISTVITCGLLIAVNNILDLTGTTEYSYNYQMHVQENTNEEVVQPNGTKFIDILSYTMIIASIGIAIDVAIKACNATEEDRKILKVFDKTGKYSSSTINIFALAWLGIFVPILISVRSAVINEEIKLPLLNYESIIFEIVRFVITLANAILVIPITTILSREILYKTKKIAEGQTTEN